MLYFISGIFVLIW